LTQSGGVVKEVWNSTLKKVRKNLPSVDKCLILGLGGGSVARLVKRYWPQAKITGVDVDPVMVEMGKKYLGLGEVRMKTIIGDAFEFINHLPSTINHRQYDLILVDTYNGDRYPKKLESEKFLKLVAKSLAPSGVVVFNRLYWDEKRKLARKFSEKLEEVFEDVMPFYPEANVMYICWVK